MKCLNPYRMKNPKYPEESSLRYLDCACGKCINCLKNKRREWFYRLYNEAISNDLGTNFFISLDYAPEYCDFKLHKDHLQKLIKRVRKCINFKYYAIGEYGTDDNCTHRPHYHIIAFFPRAYVREFIQMYFESKWQYGSVDVGEVEPASINYVLHYHVRPKNPFGDDDPRKTFCVMSQGLGLQFLDQNLRQFIHNLVLGGQRIISDPVNGVFVIPRYYIKKLKDYGVPVPEPTDVDYSKSNMRDFLTKIDPKIEFYSNCDIKPQYIDYAVKLIHDIINDNKRKLAKYNKQTKFTKR